MREDQEYQGQRVTLQAFLGKARIPVRVDVGFGDVVTPKATKISYPTLLDFPAPRVRACPRETVVAEKLQAMVMLGIWFALQVFNALGSLGLSSVVNVAYTAHVGGFVAGALFMVIYKVVNRQPVWPPRNSALSNVRYWRGRPLD